MAKGSLTPAALSISTRKMTGGGLSDGAHSYSARNPARSLPAGKIPGHWLLARLGKKVLRPGGLEMTQVMLRALAIRPCDHVVEFAPGVGATSRLVLSQHPASYTAVEQDPIAAEQVGQLLTPPAQRCLLGSATHSNLPDRSATVVFGEAMLTMQGPEQKQQIIREAARILQPRGCYGIHELCFLPNDIEEARKREIQQALSREIHVGARPLTASEWRHAIEEAGFSLRAEQVRPMRLLQPRQLFRDEGIGGLFRMTLNLCLDRAARRRVLLMRRVFARYQAHLGAIVLVGMRNPT